MFFFESYDDFDDVEFVSKNRFKREAAREAGGGPLLPVDMPVRGGRG